MGELIDGDDATIPRYGGANNLDPWKRERLIAEAKARGDDFYIGKPCKRGHNGKRDLLGRCIECRTATIAKYRKSA